MDLMGFDGISMGYCSWDFSGIGDFLVNDGENFSWDGALEHRSTHLINVHKPSVFIAILMEKNRVLISKLSVLRWVYCGTRLGSIAFHQ